MVLQAFRVLPVQQVRKAILVLQAHRELQDYKARRGHKVAPELQVLRDRQDLALQGCRAHKDCRVLRVSPGHKDHRV